MTNNEFKAWFEGFSENIQGRPTAKQWKRIQDRVAEINGCPITPQWWVTYYPSYPSYYGWHPTPITTTAIGKSVSGGTVTNVSNNLMTTDTVKLEAAGYCNSLKELGRLEGSVG